MTYPMSGALPQYCKYVGEFVPDYNVQQQYFYLVVAYDRNRTPLTTSAPISSLGPTVLDGDHAIDIHWSPVIGASFFNVFKSIGSAPPADESLGIWWNASASETGVLDVGYPCTTRNSFLNPGSPPIFTAEIVPPPEPPPVDPCAGCDDTPVAPLAAKEEVDYGLR